MNAIEFLKEQHREVEKLFEAIENGQDLIKNTAELIKALQLHTQLEESFFYPKLQQKKATQKFVEHALEEHADAKGLIAQLEGSTVGSLEWSDNVQMLNDSVTHHVEEEESEMFPVVKETFSEEILNDLGEVMERYS